MFSRDTSEAEKATLNGLINFDYIQECIATLPALLDRKQTLAAVELALKKDLVEAIKHFRGKTLVALMEGYTGAKSGRRSTDGDENMAAVMFAALIAEIGMVGHIVVPDAGNLAHTCESLRIKTDLPIEKLTSKQFKTGTVYVSSAQDATAVEEIFHQSPDGRLLSLLAPVFAPVDTLLQGNVQINIMGKATQDGEKLINTSTNTRGDPTIPRSVESTTNFVRKALSLKPIMVSSDQMDRNWTIALDELEHGSDIIGPPEKQHWIKNTKQQMTGVGAPHHLLDKRLGKGGAYRFFGLNPDGTSQISLNEEKGKGLVFVPLLERVSKATTNLETLQDTVEELGIGYEFLMKKGGDEKAKAKLKELFIQNPSVTKEDVDKANQVVDKLDEEHTKATSASVSLAFKNIYDEKTTDGWDKVCNSKQCEPGDQCKADNFEAAYLASGRQTPYDMHALYAFFGGVPKTPKEQRDAADKCMLLLWGAQKRV